MATPPSLSIAVLLFPDHQNLDAVGTMDYLNSHSQAYLANFPTVQHLVPKAPILTWYFVSDTLDPITATSGPKQLPTHTYATCPPVDCILVPGIDPFLPLSEGCTEFLKKDPKVILLTVCTGSLVIAQTGVLDGHNVASNKWALKLMVDAGKLNKAVHWVGDARWVRDGRVWSAAGVTAGIDLAAEFARSYFDLEVVEFVKVISEEVVNPDRPDPYAYVLEGVDLGAGK
ncbi:uncharacterized protein LACBIDRAFT_294865 [Laccaria bicolor S238N-H82]|uniref:Predicted protein n=1 Tax=Laccaria bicolor (strain S238N-H82 / ATCC MYA-4686) TaxID=486041 RepID=B0DJG2_LACBS|nr:uncharacterized protein LACBIDRAFT_294865 [Laccaria bicolor S238N-H82]EDR05113.1 predicted protein [Laccaria bicolor S238N-H82]|eukprot:XP_001884078.1 predicted protein [Laccaria bicolor S238N-H82]